jgi:hypothetical protein
MSGGFVIAIEPDGIGLVMHEDAYNRGHAVGLIGTASCEEAFMAMPFPHRCGERLRQRRPRALEPPCTSEFC